MNLLAYRFPQSDLTLKPGSVKGDRALCLVYADTRAYQDALDAAGVVWATTIVAVNDKTVIVALTIDGVTRSASGEDTDFMSAEARAFKRACSAFGLGRYLYSIDLGWQPYDGKHFGQAAYNALQKALQPAEPWQAWTKPEDAYQWCVSTGCANATVHAKNALKKLVTERFEGAIKQSNWNEVARTFYHERLERKMEKTKVAA
jgi:hypothetical protein